MNSTVTCPCKGMRAPEMATGAWRAVVERVAAVHAVDLLRPLDGVGDADRVAILGAWGPGKAHIVYLATIKFGFWANFHIDSAA